MNRLSLLIALAASLATAAAAPGAPQAATDTIVVRDAWLRESSAMQKATGAYLVIENHSTQPTALVSVTASGAKIAELHRMDIVYDRMTMKRVDQIPVGAGETVELRPGGFHVMLFGMAAPYTVGERVALTLHFSNGMNKTVQADVRKRGAMPSAKPGDAK